MVTSRPPRLVFLGKLKYEQSDDESFDIATRSLLSVSHRKSISQQLRKERRLWLTRIPQETSSQTQDTVPDRLPVSPAICCVSCGTWGASSKKVKRIILDRTRGGTANFVICLREYESLEFLHLHKIDMLAPSVGQLNDDIARVRINLWWLNFSQSVIQQRT